MSILNIVHANIVVKEEFELNAYRLLFFLTLLNLLNFVDRQLIASFSNFIVPDLGLTNAQYGFLTTIPFIVFYSVAGLFMGILADMVKVHKEQVCQKRPKY